VKPHAPSPAIEVEIKLAVQSAAKARALLRRLDFKVIAPRIFERNRVLDDNEGSLRARGRSCAWREAGKVSTCTFKGPDIPGRHKRRTEREFIASDAEACLALFAGLGFRESFRYEKYAPNSRAGTTRALPRSMKLPSASSWNWKARHDGSTRPRGRSVSPATLTSPPAMQASISRGAREHEIQPADMCF